MKIFGVTFVCVFVKKNAAALHDKRLRQISRICVERVRRLIDFLLGREKKTNGWLSEASFMADACWL